MRVENLSDKVPSHSLLASSLMSAVFFSVLFFFFFCRTQRPNPAVLKTVMVRRRIDAQTIRSLGVFIGHPSCPKISECPRARQALTTEETGRENQ